MSRIKEELSTLKETDIYSLILFSLFKLRNIPEYASLSELVYILDRESLLKLCEYFGGMTLKIPTIQELESLVYVLVLYQYVNIDGMNYDDAIKLIGYKSSDLKRVKADYRRLCSILDEYDFKRRG